MKRFIHPEHAKGLKSQDLNILTLGPLSNRKIKKYILAGKYGETAKEKELRKKPVPKKRVPKYHLNDI